MISSELQAMVQAVRVLQAMEERVEAPGILDPEERERVARETLDALPPAADYLRVELGVFLRAEPGEARIAAGKRLLRAIAREVLRKTADVPEVPAPPTPEVLAPEVPKPPPPNGPFDEDPPSKNPSESDLARADTVPPASSEPPVPT